LKTIGKENPTRQEMRTIVCGQCHCTYYVKKSPEKKSIDVVFPWTNSKWGEITIENIIADLRNNTNKLEWKQKVTGFSMAFIRHPEIEFYTNKSVHFMAGVSCADCHMPYTRVGSNKISNHNVMSPLKDDMRACLHCHVETAEELRKQVYTIQDRAVSMMNRSGYSTATVAKLFEMVHNNQKNGVVVDQKLYDSAKDFYTEAFYRVVFLGAENSIGFHNPTEAGRIATDAVAFAGKAETLLRQALTKAGVDVPEVVNLELAKYVNNRGTKEKKGTLKFKPEQEFKDPSGIQEKLLPRDQMGL
jgi:nitrite reductase (cytochrome c-552)